MPPILITVPAISDTDPHVQPALTYAITETAANTIVTTTEMVTMALAEGVQVKSLSVQNTTLDDVFVHYTGRQLRDEQVKAFAYTGYVFGQEMR